MRRWPIRFKLFAGLSLVTVMLLALLGGSIYGLHSFHETNLKLTDQLRELGASTRLVRTVVQIETTRLESPLERFTLQSRIDEARRALADYWDQLRDNASRGHRPDVQDELEVALQIDDDLTAMLTQLQPMRPAEPMLPVTKRHHKQQAELGIAGAPLTLGARISRLNQHVMSLPSILHRDFYGVLNTSRTQWESSRFIVIVSALFVVGMMIALLALVNRWVLNPVRLLHRGVRRVTRGDFDYKIALQSGDEMQALAEAFNEMTERLGATYTDLERQVDERSRQLVRSERLAGVGFLAAGVAHEINNPLASIAFCSEALERRLSNVMAHNGSGDLSSAANYLRMIQEEAFRCKRITEKLLDFSRCGEIQRERTDLIGLVEGVVEMIQHMGKYRGKQILFQPREAVFAHADAQEIKQVVLNLVVNALDHMDQGATLHIEVRHRGGMAEMVFDDEGCGMSPETLENIFEPFFTRRRGGKGTGLGLSITHNIVSQHGGEITATSPGEGKGSTFIVRLPLRPAEREPKPLYDSDTVQKPQPGPLAAAGILAVLTLMCGVPTRAGPTQAEATTGLTSRTTERAATPRPFEDQIRQEFKRIALAR
jgi:signal transduction histidine kinase